MKPLVRILLVAFILVLLTLPAVAPAFAAGPPDLTQIDSQVALKTMAAWASRTAHLPETESRNQISSLGPARCGPFDSQREIEGSDGSVERFRYRARRQLLLCVPFGFSPRSARMYTVTIRYDVFHQA